MGRKDIRDKINSLLERAFDNTIFNVSVHEETNDSKYAMLFITRKDDPLTYCNNRFPERAFRIRFSYIMGFKTSIFNWGNPMPIENEIEVGKILNFLNTKTKELRKSFFESLSGKEMLIEEMKKIIIKNIPDIDYIDSGCATYWENMDVDRIKGYPLKFFLKSGFEELEDNESLNKVNKETAFLRFYYQKGITSKKDVKELISFPE